LKVLGGFDHSKLIGRVFSKLGVKNIHIAATGHSSGTPYFPGVSRLIPPDPGESHIFQYPVSDINIPRIDISPETRQFRLIPRGASNDAEMAVSRTLEPDPGHAGVGTENGVTSA